MAAVLKAASAPTRADFHDAISRRSNCWYSVCLRLTRSRDLAEDAVQDALLTAWNKRQQFDGSARLETWIHRIVVNAALQLGNGSLTSWLPQREHKNDEQEQE